MTIGEYGKMINGEGWLNEGLQCELTVITCENYDHLCTYDLLVRPSPNLPNSTSIFLYPTLGLFEGTVVSEGRGTPFPFQVYGHPDFKMEFSFTPEPLKGGGAHNKYPGKICYGEDFRTTGANMVFSKQKLLLEIIIMAFQEFGEDPGFFNRPDFFDKLAGTDKLRNQILKGASVEDIQQSWKEGLTNFKKIRKKYLLYPDFE